MRMARSLLIALALVAMGATSVLAAPSDPFRGAWVSVDAVDGSNQRLSFGGGGSTRNINLWDQDATACGGGPAVVRAVGEVSGDGDSITGTHHLRCANGATPGDTDVTYTYDPDAGTLMDNFGTEWMRP